MERCLEKHGNNFTFNFPFERYDQVYVFCVMMWKVTDVSEDFASSIFRLKYSVHYVTTEKTTS
jgi:hypothetical protein